MAVSTKGALQRMEDHLYNSLGLPARSTVTDAGCGVCHVTLRLARKGLRVYGTDVMENQVLWTEEEIRAHGQENTVEVRLMDYNHLDDLIDDSFDGLYTMEISVHATDPETVLAELYGVVSLATQLLYMNMIINMLIRKIF